MLVRHVWPWAPSLQSSLPVLFYSDSPRDGGAHPFTCEEMLEMERSGSGVLRSKETRFTVASRSVELRWKLALHPWWCFQKPACCVSPGVFCRLGRLLCLISVFCFVSFIKKNEIIKKIKLHPSVFWYCILLCSWQGCLRCLCSISDIHNGK